MIVAARSATPARLPFAVAGGSLTAGVLGVVAAASVDIPLVAPAFVVLALALPIVLTRPLWLVLALAVEDVANLGTVGAQHGVAGIHLALLTLTAVSVVVAILRRRLTFRPPPLVVALAGLYLLVQLFVALVTGLAPDSVVAVTETAKDLVLVGLVALVITDTSRALQVTRGLVATAAALALLSLVQEFALHNNTDFGGLSNVPLVKDPGSLTERHSGPLLDPNFWGRVLVMMLPLALSLAASASAKVIKQAWGAATAVLAAGIVLTGSRGTLLAMALAVGAWMALAGPRYRRLLLFSPLVLVVLLYVPGVGTRLATLAEIGTSTPSLARGDPSLEGRRTAQEAGLFMIRDNPLIGVGPGRFLDEMPEYQRRYALDESLPLAAHNLYIEQAAEGGVLLLLAWSALFGSAVIVALRVWLVSRRRSGHDGSVDAQNGLLASGVLAALAGWAAASAFLHLSTFRTLLFVMAIAAGLELRTGAQQSPARAASVAGEPARARPSPPVGRRREKRRRAVLLASAAAALAGAALQVPALSNDEWETQVSARLIVDRPPVQAYDQDALGRDAVLLTFAAMAADRAFAVQAGRQLGISEASLREHDVNVANRPESALVTFTVRGPDEAEVQDLALTTREIALTRVNDLAPLYQLRPDVTTAPVLVTRRDRTRHAQLLAFLTLAAALLTVAARSRRPGTAEAGLPPDVTPVTVPADVAGVPRAPASAARRPLLPIGRKRAGATARPPVAARSGLWRWSRPLMPASLSAQTGEERTNAAALPLRAGADEGQRPESAIMASTPAHRDPSAPLTTLPPADLAQSLLSRADELFGVTEAAAVIIQTAVDATGADSAALLLPDEGRWRVAAGRNLTSTPRPYVLSASSWLVHEVAWQRRGLLLNDSDPVRRQIGDLPLASDRQLLAAPVAPVNGLLLLGAAAGPGFTERDLAAMAVLSREAAPIITEALMVRQLARLLSRHRDDPSSAGHVV